MDKRGVVDFIKVHYLKLLLVTILLASSIIFVIASNNQGPNESIINNSNQVIPDTAKV